MKYFVIAVLVLLVLFFIYKAMQKPKPKPQDEDQTPPEPAFGTLKLSHAKVGDAAVIRGAGTDFEDMHLTIDRVAEYAAGSDRWGEVSGIYHNKRVYVEWMEDDVFEVAINNGDSIRLRDLDITEDDLIRFDEEQSDHNSVNFNGKEYHFVESQEAEYREDRGSGFGGGEGFYLWDFKADDGEQLWIEKWEDEPFEGGLSTPVNPDTVTLYRA